MQNPQNKGFLRVSPDYLFLAFYLDNERIRTFPSDLFWGQNKKNKTKTTELFFICVIFFVPVIFSQMLVSIFGALAKLPSK